ncbi:DUF2778 domain-containing protein [Paraburkholderia sp. BL10I2N1]|uniref:DUF2778 domain-containing protein n=1 Tax=Paraburkholderia sp. BL10I2N1 TaxID=1938796 RepID=UPI00105B8F38|nr:DUF2778 domain-containing protein [Paraburkholderia sp. BL10I2N1]TDN61769.1 uncharacterized protein DUF2778 [Paraburkholderia sp. BL10I2N1]
MAVTGKFIIDNQWLAPLTIFGVGTFNAYSGNAQYRNRGGCTAVPENGPLPAGKYWIVPRPTGGVRSAVETWLKDEFNHYSSRPTDHSEWFALYRDDGKIDDYTWIDGVRRGNFRLHPAGGRGLSLGCITLPSRTDFLRIRTALLHTKTIPVRNSALNAYGSIEVVTHGNTCP